MGSTKRRKNDEDRHEPLRQLIRALHLSPEVFYPMEELVALVSEYNRPEDVFSQEKLTDWYRRINEKSQIERQE